jgi:hypothetical protein
MSPLPKNDPSLIAKADKAAADLLESMRKYDPKCPGFQLAYRLQKAGATKHELREMTRAIEGLTALAPLTC